MILLSNTIRQAGNKLVKVQSLTLSKKFVSVKLNQPQNHHHPRYLHGVIHNSLYNNITTSLTSSLSNGLNVASSNSGNICPSFIDHTDVLPTSSSYKSYIRSISTTPHVQSTVLSTMNVFSTTQKGEENDETEGMVKPYRYKALSPDVLHLIKNELETVDSNKDGKIDSEEFKQLLRRHKHIFRESEILEISESFYVATSARSLPIDQILQAIDNTLTLSPSNLNGTRSSRNTKTLGVGSCAAEYYYDLNHHQWKEEEVKKIQKTHVQPQTFTDKLALSAVKLVRMGFDGMTGWNGEITTTKVLRRVIFLETIAAVPGMVAAVVRHFRSLRNMERDGGLINMFLEEATNERMHLLTFVTMKDPSVFFRAAVIGSQFAFGTGFGIAYIVNPKFCHRFVGYIEEEACATYTKIIEAIEDAPEGSELSEWKTQLAPKIGISYWHLGEKGSVLDLMYAVRADEAEHRDVNHSVVNHEHGDVNPRYDPRLRIDGALNKYVRAMMTRASNTKMPL